MNQSSLRWQWANQKSHLVLFNQQGMCLHSEGDLLPTKSGLSVYDEYPFVASLHDVLWAPEAQLPLSFQCIELHAIAEKRYFDCVFEADPATGQRVWLLFDFTEHYTYVASIQQERNLSQIQQEFLEIQQKNAELERELLEIKNEELVRQQAFRTQLFAGVSHEIRTPVQSIIGLTSLIDNKNLSVEQLEQLKAIQYAGRHLGAIVQDVLDMAHLEAGTIKLQQAAFSLHEVCHGVIQSFQYQASQKKLSVTWQTEQVLPSALNGDATRVAQILFNVIGNGIKFTQKGGVTLYVDAIKLTAGQYRVNCKVKDTGQGIRPDMVNKIFEPFKQDSAGEAAGGTGLGLHVTKKLLNLMEGDISIESTSDVGTTVSFHFFASSSQPLVTPKAKKPEPERVLEVLLAEDDDMSRLAVAGILRRAGHRVTVAQDGMEALEALSRHSFDLCLIDNQMPGMTGIEVLHAIAAKTGVKSNAGTIALLSGDPVELSEVEHLGVAQCLLKPVTPDRLLTLLNALL